MAKTSRPEKARPAARPPRKPSLLGKASRIGATMIVARVAAATGKKGVIGLVAGAGARRLIMRYPMGAMLVTGAYLASKLYKARREIDRKQGQKLLTDQRPVPPTPSRSRSVKGRPARP